MGKYDSVISALQPLPPDKPDYQAKIDVIKQSLKSETAFTPEGLALEYAKLRHVKDALSDELSEVQERITAFEQMLVESLDRDEPGWGTHGANPNTVKMVSGASVAVQYEPTAKVEDKEAFRQWCVDNGLERSLQLWPSTTNAIVKERLLAGQDTPAGVTAYAYPKIVFRGGK